MELCWQVGNFVDNGEVFPLDILYYNIFKQSNLFLRNQIIWRFGHGLHASKDFRDDTKRSCGLPKAKITYST